MRDPIFNHPCFDGHEFSDTVGRIHVPLVKSCNIKCLYCNRKTHCSHENRPGISDKLVSVEEGLNIIETLQDTNLRIIGLAGPGDPFSEPDKLFSFIKEIRKKYDNKYEICIASNGLEVYKHITALKEYEVNYMTLTINATKASTYAEIVEWIIDEGVKYRGIEAGQRLLDAQMKSLTAVVEAGMRCKVNTVIVPDINQYEIVDVTKLVKDMGAHKGNLIPLIPVEGTKFRDIFTVSIKEYEMLLRDSENILGQVKHCRKCRADTMYVQPV